MDEADEELRSEPHVVIITGMSGAGRSHTSNVLEDLKYFVVDNLPVDLIVELVERSGVGDESRDRVAVVVDTRGGVTADELSEAIKLLRQMDYRTTVLFLDADDRVLIRRFEESRRPHPVAAPTLDEAIALERANMLEIRGIADVIADTSDLNVHQLGDRLRNAFARGLPERQMQIDVTSFGFKHGVPRVVDLLFDARFLPNPHWQPELRPLTGVDASVSDYVFSFEKAGEFLEKVEDLLDFVIPEYEQEGKAYLTIGVGCTGGRHRSVAMAEAIGAHLRGHDHQVTVHHRDAGLGEAHAHQH
ncbi:MAG: RNase adapter RapZ [Actinomycetota bacterium]|nr:RNase adapter RapZ [Actinomycetota bacterium]